MQVTLNINDDAAQVYIASRVKGDNDMSDDEFIKACLLNHVQDVVCDQITANATAKALQDLSIPDVNAA